MLLVEPLEETEAGGSSRLGRRLSSRKCEMCPEVMPQESEALAVLHVTGTMTVELPVDDDEEGSWQDMLCPNSKSLKTVGIQSCLELLCILLKLRIPTPVPGTAH